jgi:hypothetical protein
MYIAGVGELSSNGLIYKKFREENKNLFYLYCKTEIETFKIISNGITDELIQNFDEFNHKEILDIHFCDESIQQKLTSILTIQYGYTFSYTYGFVEGINLKNSIKVFYKHKHTLDKSFLNCNYAYQTKEGELEKDFLSI